MDIKHSYEEGKQLKKKDKSDESKPAGTHPQIIRGQERAKDHMKRIRAGEGKKMFPSAKPPRFGQQEEET